VEGCKANEKVPTFRMDFGIDIEHGKGEGKIDGCCNEEGFVLGYR
jgi:hypothetical protein